MHKDIIEWESRRRMKEATQHISKLNWPEGRINDDLWSGKKTRDETHRAELSVKIK